MCATLSATNNDKAVCKASQLEHAVFYKSAAAGADVMGGVRRWRCAGGEDGAGGFEGILCGVCTCMCVGGAGQADGRVVACCTSISRRFLRTSTWLAGGVIDGGE